MKIIIGLGNPGEKYRQTRHNVGYDVIDYIASAYDISVSTPKYKSLLGKGRIAQQQVVLAKPQTFMNLSGEAVLALMSGLRVSPQDIVVIYDDFALQLGRIRVRKNGSAGGHNGIKSIISGIGQDFVRVRVGIGCPAGDTVDYVLSSISPGERTVLEKLFTRIAACTEMIIGGQVDAAMNMYNTAQAL
jgi:PTH1 family peptidyl-tRNA hydrolase